MDRTLASLIRTSAGGWSPLRALLRGMAATRSRRRLAELDDHLLRDIGLSRGQARLEAEKGGWDAPAHWLR